MLINYLNDTTLNERQEENLSLKKGSSCKREDRNLNSGRNRPPLGHTINPISIIMHYKHKQLNLVEQGLHQSLSNHKNLMSDELQEHFSQANNCFLAVT